MKRYSSTGYLAGQNSDSTLPVAPQSKISPTSIAKSAYMMGRAVVKKAVKPIQNEDNFERERDALYARYSNLKLDDNKIRQRVKEEDALRQKYSQ